MEGGEGAPDDRSGARQLASALHVVVITDPTLLSDRSLIGTVEAALRGGSRCVQLRDKTATAAELLEDAIQLRALTRQYDALLIVNDRFDVALASQADGVHVGPDDVPVQAIRSSVPETFIIGASCDELARARELVEAGADYLGCGTVFPTSTKPDAGAAIGPSRVTELAAALPVPIVAIGGISIDNANQLSNTGAAGVAVIGAVMGAQDPEGAVGLLRQRFTPTA